MPRRTASNRTCPCKPPHLGWLPECRWRPFGSVLCAALAGLALSCRTLREDAAVALPEATPGFEETVLREVEAGSRFHVDRGTLVLEADDLAVARRQAETIASDLGGETLSSFLQEDDYLSLKLRVPRDALARAVSRLRQCGEVRTSSVQAEDITARLNQAAQSLRAQRQELADVGKEPNTDGGRKAESLRQQVAAGEEQLHLLYEKTAAATLTVSVEKRRSLASRAVRRCLTCR